MELLRGVVTMPLAPVFGATGRCERVLCRTGLRALLIAGREHDLELIEFIPLLVRSISFRNSQERLQAKARGNRFRFIHEQHYLSSSEEGHAPILAVGGMGKFGFINTLGGREGGLEPAAFWGYRVKRPSRKPPETVLNRIICRQVIFCAA